LSLEAVLGWIRQEEAQHTLVEGVGGWRVPVAWDWSISDLACAWGAPVLVVAPNQLGVLNHVRLTVEAIAAAGLPLWGVVLNDGVSVGDAASAHNLEDLVQLLPAVWIRRMQGLEDLERETLQAAGRFLMTS
jgi:dethiobiotin synthetase